MKHIFIIICFMLAGCENKVSLNGDEWYCSKIGEYDTKEIVSVRPYMQADVTKTSCVEYKRYGVKESK